jgi:hypothetical protein
MADERYETEIEQRGDGTFVGVVYFWQTGYTGREEIRRTQPKAMRATVVEEAEGIARRHRAKRKGENERVILDLDSQGAEPTTERIDSNPAVIKVFEEVWLQLHGRLDAPLSERDSTAVRTAIMRAATEGLKSGAAMVAGVISRQDDPTKRVDLDLDGIPVPDFWADRYGDG